MGMITKSPVTILVSRRFLVVPFGCSYRFTPNLGLSIEMPSRLRAQQAAALSSKHGAIHGAGVGIKGQRYGSLRRADA